MQLQYIHHKDIDFAKWDTALTACTNKLIYAESIYLNTMAENWDALVNDDWTCIMPIPVKKKFGVLPYVPTIPFVQQLGIFSTKTITTDILETFIKKVKKKFVIVDYNFNYANPLQQKNNNFIMPLNLTYDAINANYKNDIKKDLQKNKQITIERTENYTEAILQFFETYQSRMALLTGENQRRFSDLCNYYLDERRCYSYMAMQEDKIVAIALFLEDKHRIYNLASTITDIGKKLSANHFLYDQVIKDNAGKNIIFDFEGSDIEGIKNYYLQFGTINQPYTNYTFSKIPFLLK